MKRVLIYLSIVVCIIFADLSSKHIAENKIRENESISIVGNFVKFTLIYNYGTTFGLFKNNAPYIIISVVKSISVIILIALFVYVPKFIKHSGYRLISRICILFLIGGSIGNIIDRLSDRRVTDFIDIGIYSNRWHIFNFADAFQSIGGLIFFLILIQEHKNE